MTDEEKQKIISEHMSNLSKRHWQKLSKEERSDYARKLAKERWKKRKESKNENKEF